METLWQDIWKGVRADFSDFPDAAAVTQRRRLRVESMWWRVIVMRDFRGEVLIIAT
jgi:hypothetical protein